MEGAGKSTQLRRVAGGLRRSGVEPVVTREPGGTAAGESIREILLSGPAIDPVTELFLILAARSTFVRDMVEPALRAGRVVLADRYDLSTFAYQGGGRGLPMATVRAMNEFATRGLRPDLYIVLDVEVERGAARRGDRTGDRIESEDAEFHRRVGRVYRDLARDAPEIALVPADDEIEAVFARVWTVLSERFPETFDPAQG